MAEHAKKPDEPPPGTLDRATEALDEQEELAWAIVDHLRPLLQLIADPADDGEAPAVRAALSDEERDQIATVADVFGRSSSDEARGTLDALVIAAQLRSMLRRLQRAELVNCVVEALSVLQREVDQARARLDRRLAASHLVLAPRPRPIVRR